MSALGLLIAGGSWSMAQPKGERATIKGEVVDLWCYMEGGDRGPAKKDCAIAFPVNSDRQVRAGMDHREHLARRYDGA